MPDPIRPFPLSSPGPSPGQGEDLRAGGVPPRARWGGMRARVEGVLTAASASQAVYEKGLNLAHIGRAHPTFIPWVWYIISDPDANGYVNLYTANLLEPSCTCDGWIHMSALNRAKGLVCKHIVCAGVNFIAADTQSGGLV